MHVDREQWGQELHEVWLAHHSRGLNLELAKDLSQMPPEQSTSWVMWLKRPRPPLVEMIAQWCLPADSTTYQIAAAPFWQSTKMAHALWLAYPEPLAVDPLAVAGLGLLAASADPSPHNAAWIASRLGPLVGFVAYYSGLNPSLIAPALAGWGERYRERALAEGLDWLVAWVTEHSGSPKSPSRGAWPSWPEEASDYAMQLRAGVVPHGQRSRGPTDVRAVLLGLALVPSAERMRLTALAQKAIQAVGLSAQWHQMVPEEGSQWS